MFSPLSRFSSFIGDKYWFSVQLAVGQNVHSFDFFLFHGTIGDKKKLWANNLLRVMFLYLC